MLNWKRVLVFGAHSDDEIIGPGGTIAKLSRQGAQVSLVTFTTGDMGYSELSHKGKVDKMRGAEAKISAKILGIREVVNLGLPTQSVINTRDVYQECVRLIRRFRPDVIFTHYKKDKHRDHRAVSEITDEARWKASENIMPDFGKPWYAQELYYYEVLELFTSPSLVVDITGTLEVKVRAMKTQISQLGILRNMERYIEGVAAARGFLRGTKYAEAFLASNFLAKKL
jgi:LmbE family N-acetylglucosaminyl deacetylase